jgi:hypothetical protein
MRAFYASSFLLAWGVAAHGQGTVLFRNFDAATGFSAPAFHDDCVTRLSGTCYLAELWVAPDVQHPNPQTIAQTTFLTGGQAGYFDGGLVTLPNLPSGSQPLLVVVVYSSMFGSYPAAQASGAPDAYASATFQVTLGDQASPAILTPLPALWLNNLLDVPPVPLYVNFNRVDNTAVVSWETYLEVSTNLVQWTNFVGSSPHAFPLNQGPVFFRSKMYPR